MLDLHAHHARSISQRAAPILWVAEQAAPADPEEAKLWAQSTDNRRTGAQWAATTLLAKPGVPPHISQRHAEDMFWIAVNPGRGIGPPAPTPAIAEAMGSSYPDLEFSNVTCLGACRSA